MAVELVYKDGTTEVFERCWIVYDRTKKGKPRQRFVAQRRKGKLKWIRTKDVEKVNIEMPADYQPPEPWPPSPEWRSPA